MLKFTFNALIQQQLRPLHTAEKHRPTMFHTATVRPRRSGPRILYNTPLRYQRNGTVLYLHLCGTNTTTRELWHQNGKIKLCRTPLTAVLPYPGYGNFIQFWYFLFLQHFWYLWNFRQVWEGRKISKKLKSLKMLKIPKKWKWQKLPHFLRSWIFMVIDI